MYLTRLRFACIFLLFINSVFLHYPSIAQTRTDQSVIENISFKKISLADALAILSEQSDIKVIASEQAADIQVSLYLSKVTAQEVVSALVKAYNLWYQKDAISGITWLHTQNEGQPGQIGYKPQSTKTYRLEEISYPEEQFIDTEDINLNEEPLAYTTPIAQIEFKAIRIGDALRILSEQSGINVIASEEAANIVVTMFLRNVTAMEVIDAISKTYNLWYQRDERTNIVRLYTVKEYRLEKVDFKKEETEIFTMKNAKNALDFAETIQNLFGTNRVNLSFGDNPRALLRDLNERFQLFDMIDGRTSLVQGGGSGGGGGNNNRNNNRNNNQNNLNNGFNNSFGNNFNNRNNNNLLGNRNNVQLDEYLDTTEKVIKRFGESRAESSGLSSLLLGSQDDTRALMSATIRHQAPIYVGVIGRQNRVLVRTRDSDAMAEIRRLYHRLDMESSMLMMEVKILSIDLSDGYNSLFDFKLKSGDFTVSSLEKTSTVDALGTAANAFARAAASSFDPTFLATVVSENFEARLQLYEQEGRVTELATPLLLTSNQEVSKVFVGEERPVTTGFSSSTNQDSGNNLNINTSTIQPILVPNTEVRAIGTTLLLTPNINADRTVDIRVLVEQSAIGDDQATIPVPLDNELVDAEIDVVQERTFSGTVVASDMQAIAVGGLIEESSGNQEKKVPVLGDIPGLGFFFKETAKTRERKELVVIIKPYIMTAPDQAEPISRHILANNSIHPDALDRGDHMMDIYKNDRRNIKGYELQPDYKLYDKQDAFDKYHGKGSLEDTPAQQEHNQAASGAAQQTYIELTQYAAKAIRLPIDERDVVPSIEEVFVASRGPASILYDERVKVIPVAGWRKGGVNLTAFELHNVSGTTVRVDFKNLKGQWLASTVEDEQLAPQGQFGDSTYLYLISAESFDEIMARHLGAR